MRPLLVAATLAAVMLPAVAGAQTANPTTLTPFAYGQPVYLQDFDTLASTGTTGSALPAGFQIVENGSNANASYGIGNGSSNTGNSYSFGATGSGERALGSLGSGSLTPIYYGGVFTNALGSTITSLAFSYTGEQWRLTNSTTDGLTFQYQVGATGVGGAAGWTTVDALAFTPARTDGTAAGAAIDGNDPANQRQLSSVISGLSLGNGATFGFRWVDVDSTGADQGLAVDNLRIAATTASITGALPEPGVWAMMIAGFGLVGAAMRRRRALPRTALA